MYSDTGTSAHIIIHNPGTFDRDALLDYFHVVETRAEPASRGNPKTNKSTLFVRGGMCSNLEIRGGPTKVDF